VPALAQAAHQQRPDPVVVLDDQHLGHAATVPPVAAVTRAVTEP
jgi:hypothetical protein